MKISTLKGYTLNNTYKQGQVKYDKKFEGKRAQNISFGDGMAKSFLLPFLTSMLSLFGCDFGSTQIEIKGDNYNDKLIFPPHASTAVIVESKNLPEYFVDKSSKHLFALIDANATFSYLVDGSDTIPKIYRSGTYVDIDGADHQKALYFVSSRISPKDYNDNAELFDRSASKSKVFDGVFLPGKSKGFFDCVDTAQNDSLTEIVNKFFKRIHK